MSSILKISPVVIALGLAFVVSGRATIGCAEEAPPPRTVADVDIERYLGTWYEISRLPNWFQAGCAGGTTATYSLRPDGKIEVVNRCRRRDGSENLARGIARIVDTETNARLEVSFFRPFGIPLFWGDYWVIGLGTEYEYAIVGTPGRDYGWVLARKPELTPPLSAAVDSTLQAQGYDPAEFAPSPP